MFGLFSSLKYYPCSVVGESFDNADGSSRQKILGKTKPKEKVYFIFEADNEFDKEAIAVYTKRGQIGYMPKDSRIREMVRECLSKNIQFKSSIKNVSKTGKYYGAVLKIQKVSKK